MKIRIVAALLMLLLLLGGCAAMERAENTVESFLGEAEAAVESMVYAASPAASGEITAEEARQIALDHAGLNAEQVKYLRVEYEIDDGLPQYEVAFHYDRWEYDYEIDARTGNILSFEKDD